MAIQLFSAVIYLPIIVICMIISQIYFERYWESFQGNKLANCGLVAAITITYFIQEFCLLQLSLLNINEVAFMQVVSVTMVFRNSKNKLWWGLLAITPIFANAVEVLLGIESISTWWIWLGESAIFLLVCGVLVQWKGISIRIRYPLAILSLSLVGIISLGIENNFTVVTVAAATLGLMIILFFESRRYESEIRNEEKIKLLQRESERDDLTGLLNYRALSQGISALTEDRDIHSIVIGGLDIGHFKRINDTYGHFVGNEVLNYFSTVFRKKIHEAFPDQGYVYRFGGEEFTIVVSNHSIEEVYALLQTIEKQFSEQPIVTKEGVKITINFSCSLTNHLNGELLDLTLKRADKMLYSVKNNGRGWIVIDHHSTPEENVAVN